MMKRFPILASLTLLLALRPVHAEDDLAAQILGSAEPEPRHNAGIALMLSLGATILPLVLANQISEASDQGSNTALLYSLVAGGTLIGPSAGQFYVGSLAGGILGVGGRVAGMAIAMAGVGQAMSTNCPMSFGGSVECGEDDDGDGSGAMLLGLGVYVAATVYSLVDPAVAVRRERERGRSAFAMTPTLGFDAGGRLRSGLLAGFRF